MLKKILLILIVMISTYHLFSQSNDIKAKAYFIEAQENFGNGNSRSALVKLDKALDYLGGRTNPRVEALYVRIYRDLRNPLEAEKHLNLYFKKANEGSSDYFEMLKLVTVIEENANYEREKIKQEKEAEKIRKEEELKRLEEEAERKKLEEEENKRREKEAEIQRVKDEKDAELKRLKEAEELKERQAQELVEKQEYEVDLIKLNKLIDEGEMFLAKDLHLQMVKSDWYSEEEIKNYSLLKCYEGYEKAQKINTVEAYYSFLKENKKNDCSGNIKAKNKLEELSIKKGDELHNSSTFNMRKKSIKYYKMYLEYFPNGSKSSYASSRIRNLELKEVALKKKKERASKHSGYEMFGAVFTLSNQALGIKFFQVYDKGLGLTFDLKVGGVPNFNYEGLYVNSFKGLSTDGKGSLQQNSQSEFYDLSDSYYGENNFSEYTLNRYSYNRKKKTKCITLGMGVNYKLAYPFWGYANLGLGYVATQYSYTKTEVEGRNIGAQEDILIVYKDKSGFRFVPEFGVLLPLKKLHLSLGAIKYPDQPLLPVFGLGYSF